MSQMSDDMISRADAIAILEDEMPGHYLSKKTQIVTKLRALPAIEVGVRELEWRKVAPYGLHEAYGLCWRYQIREGTDAIVRWQAGHMGTWFEAANVDAAKTAAQADYDARIRSALTANPAQDVVGWRNACRAMPDIPGLPETYQPRNIAAALDGYIAALARMTEASPRPINWRDDQEAVVEDDEPMIGRDYE